MPVFLHISYILHLHLKHMLFPQARLMDEAVWVVSHAYPPKKNFQLFKNVLTLRGVIVFLIITQMNIIPTT